MYVCYPLGIKAASTINPCDPHKRTYTYLDYIHTDYILSKNSSQIEFLVGKSILIVTNFLWCGSSKLILIICHQLDVDLKICHTGCQRAEQLKFLVLMVFMIACCLLKNFQ